IPMTTAHYDARPSNRVMRIGIAGGHAKPSTGYAFVAVQRFARRLAAALAQTPLPPTPRVRPLRTELLDAVFLHYLARHPANAPGLFRRMFERVPSARLIRFLSDKGTPLDDLRVMN